MSNFLLNYVGVIWISKGDSLKFLRYPIFLFVIFVSQLITVSLLGQDFFHLGFDNQQLVKKNYNAQTVLTWLLQCMSFNITLCSNLSHNWLCCLFEISKAKGKVVNSQKVHSPGQHAFRCRHLWLYKLFVRFNYDWLNAVPTKYYCQTRCSNHTDSNVTKNLKPMLKWNKQATRKQEKHILLVIHRTRYIQIIKIYNRITFFFAIQ